MGNKLPMAREEEEGWSELLARVGYRVSESESYSRDKRTRLSSARRGCKSSETEDTETESESPVKAKGTNGVSTRSARRRRDNKNRKQNGRDEGEDRVPRRSAQELGIVYPDKCSSGSHYWKESEKIHGGVLFQCSKCYEYLWLPFTISAAEQLSKLIERFGNTEGYCRYLNHATRRPAKLLMAKMQELGRLSNSTADSSQLISEISRILGDKEYDKAQQLTVDKSVKQ